MRNDAVVLAVRKKRAVVLGPDGVFQSVRNCGYTPGQRIEWREESNVRPIGLARRTLLVAACLVVLLVPSALAVSKYVPLTQVTVRDGAVAIRYHLNALNEVLSAEAETEEAQSLLAEVASDTYEPVESVLTRTLEAMNDPQPDSLQQPVTVEISSRLVSGDSAEEAVSLAGTEAGTPVRIERTEWQDRRSPDPPAQSPREKVPESIPPEEPGEAPESQPFQGQDAPNPLPEPEMQQAPPDAQQPSPDAALQPPEQHAGAEQSSLPDSLPESPAGVQEPPLQPDSPDSPPESPANVQEPPLQPDSPDSPPESPAGVQEPPLQPDSPDSPPESPAGVQEPPLQPGQPDVQQYPQNAGMQPPAAQEDFPEAGSQPPAQNQAPAPNGSPPGPGNPAPGFSPPV